MPAAMRVLVVVERDLEARMIAYLLASRGYDATIAGTLAAAERHLAEGLWPALILDATLPDGSGADLIARLARRGDEGGVLVLGPPGDVARRVRLLEAGADDYLARPFEPAELLARVGATARRSRRRAERGGSSSLRVGGIELDLQSMRVTLPGGRRAVLSPGELRVLHYLMAHADRAVTPGELGLALAGGVGGAPGANTVGASVRRVRRKIEPDPARPRYILTVRGTGYRFHGHG